MVDMQKNPRLLMICNHLNPIEQLNLREPEFRPVLEILDKEYQSMEIWQVAIQVECMRKRYKNKHN